MALNDSKVTLESVEVKVILIMLYISSNKLLVTVLRSNENYAEILLSTNDGHVIVWTITNRLIPIGDGDACGFDNAYKGEGE